MKNEFLCVVVENGKRQRKILSFDEIYNNSRPIVFNILRRKYFGYRNEWEDIFQDVMLNVYQTLQKEDGTKDCVIYHFVQFIAKRRIYTAVMKIDKHKRRNVPIPEYFPEASVGFIESNSTEEDIWADISEFFTPQERQIVELKLDGLNNTEVYNALHKRPYTRIGPGMIKPLRAIGNKLQEILGGGGA